MVAPITPHTMPNRVMRRLLNTGYRPARAHLAVGTTKTMVLPVVMSREGVSQEMNR